MRIFALVSSILILLISIFIAVNSQAQAVRPLATIGAGVMHERENDNLTESTRFPLSIAAGLRMNVWDTRVEYSSFKTSDGNQSLTTTREHQSWLAWAAYEFIGEKGWAPYAAAALGIGRSNVESRLGPATEAYSGAWAGTFALAVGLRSAWTSHFVVRPEFRYESADSYKTKDARMGGLLQIDYIF